MPPDISPQFSDNYELENCSSLSVYLTQSYPPLSYIAYQAQRLNMLAEYLLVVVTQALAVSSAAISTKERSEENWNAAAWSNFVKSYVEGAENLERDAEANWNAAAWSNFVKSYVDGAESVKRDVENWKAVAWSNFVKSYVNEAEEIKE
ncbi:hypothetical protein F5Y16DRAFT_397041 [Xylariaceae sp. FL0255]|nr:hypothetical protein F5Y16DRAFT_397041 [Xylariaceae sp. FL0255]